MRIALSFFNTQKKTFEFNNDKRQYLLHLPASYKNGGDFPLVIALHGYTDNPRLMEFYTGLSKKADKKKLHSHLSIWY